MASKSLSIQTGKINAKKPAEPEPESEPESAETVKAGGLSSKDKQALAMSFFDGGGAKSKPKSKPKKAEDPDLDLPAVQNATPKPFVRERAYYEPDDNELPEEEDILPTFKSRPRQQLAKED